MIDSRVGYNHFMSNNREWNNCFNKNNQEIFLDLADFALQEQPTRRQFSYRRLVIGSEIIRLSESSRLEH